MQAIGIDLGVKTGAAVLLNGQEAAQVVASWSTPGVKTTAPPNVLTQHLQNVLIQPLAKVGLLAGTLVAIDWDPNDTYWGNSRQAISKGFLAGYLYRYLLAEHLKPVFMPPSYVRMHLELKAKANKRDVFKVIGAQIQNPSLLSCYSNMNEHEKDSFILAFLSLTHLT